MLFTQLLNKLPTKYVKALRDMVLRCDCAHEEFIWKGIFNEGLLDFICNNMTSYWGSWKSRTAHIYVRHGTLLAKFPRGRVMHTVRETCTRWKAGARLRSEKAAMPIIFRQAGCCRCNYSPCSVSKTSFWQAWRYGTSTQCLHSRFSHPYCPWR